MIEYTTISPTTGGRYVCDSVKKGDLKKENPIEDKKED